MKEHIYGSRLPVKVLLFLFCAILLFVSPNTGYDFLSTLDRLKLAEAERD